MKRVHSVFACGMILALSTVLSFAQAPKSASGAFDTDTQSKLDAAFKETASFKDGAKDDNLKLIESAIAAAQVSKEKRAFILPRLTDLFKPDTTIECKRFAAKQMLFVGTEESAKALAGLLTNPEASAPACYALERIPGEGVSALLRDALPKTSGKMKAGIINSLGQRHDAKAVAAVAPALGDSDPLIAKSAALALGQIGTPEAAEALTAARVKAPEAVLAQVCDGLLLCADQMARSKEQEAKATAIYEKLVADGKPDQIRGAAFRGLAMIKGDKGPALIIEALKGKDDALIPAAVALVRELPQKSAGTAVADALAGISAERQPQVIYALADRGALEAAAPVLKASESENEEVRAASLAALGRIGGASAIPALTKAAATPKTPREQGIARDSLDRLRGADVNEAMAKALAGAGWDPLMRAELVRSLGARAAKNALPSLMKAATDENADVRKEALKSLAVVAAEKDMPAVIEFLVKAPSDAERKNAEALVLAVARKITDDAKRAEAILKALDAASQSGARCSLLAILGKLAAPTALPALKKALTDKDAEVQKAAIRSLSDWPDSSPLEDMGATVKNAGDPGVRGLALRGYAQLIALPSDRTGDETVKLLEDAMAQAKTNDEKKAVLSAIGKVRHARALELAKRFAQDNALKAEASLAVKQIETMLKQPWQVSASDSGGADIPMRAIDGDIKTRWGTGRGQEKGQWFLIDLGEPAEVKSIALDCASSGGDYPREYAVYVSNDPKNWGDPLATGAGKAPVTDIKLKEAKKGRLIRILQNGAAGGNWWSIYELKINGKAAAEWK